MYTYYMHAYSWLSWLMLIAKFPFLLAELKDVGDMYIFIVG